MFSKFKGYIVALIAILAGLFVYERSRRKSAEAIADNQEVLDELNNLDKQKVTNDGKLQSEEDKRAELKKEEEDDKSNTDGNSDFFNDRYSK